MRRARRQSGFTLLETLVAFTIAVGALTLLYRIHSGATAIAMLAGDHRYAAALAEALIVEAGATTTESESRRSGVFDDRFRWQATVSPYTAGGAGQTPRVPLRRITVRVEWTDRDDAQSVTYTTLQPRPELPSGNAP